MPQIILDHDLKILMEVGVSPLANCQALPQAYHGLYFIANQIRAMENKSYIPPGAVNFYLHYPADGVTNSLVACFFNWFATTSVNYFRLVGMVDIMTKNGWRDSDLEERAISKRIKAHCGDYVKAVIPEVLAWRNKVAAHPAATDARDEDNVATLQSSIIDNVVWVNNLYRVGAVRIKMASGAESELPEWSLTETYEKLTPRFWPDQAIDPLGSGDARNNERDNI